jgi:putative Holliday junction resolvase
LLIEKRNTRISIRNNALAFDYGERRIGVAFANRVTNTATALKTLQAREGQPVPQDILALIDEWQPDVFVVGVPYALDGSDSPMALRAVDFGKTLGEKHGLPVETVDERLTSADASMMLREQRRTGARRRKVRRGDIDSLAAQLIAESWLRDQ